jgi:hypothetical protein
MIATLLVTAAVLLAILAVLYGSDSRQLGSDRHNW